MTAQLIDTDILIDLANGDTSAKSWFQAIGQQQTKCVSIITVMELLVGCRNKSEQYALNQFLLAFQIYPLTPAISDQAWQLMQQYTLSHGLQIPDALIAATAMAQNIALVSKNQRDYRYIETLNLLPYP